MKCNQVWISAYLDQELDPGATALLLAHLQECAACQTSVNSLRALRSTVAAHASSHIAPSDLRQKIQADLDALKTRPVAKPALAGGRNWNWLSGTLAATGSLALALSLTLYLNLPGAQDNLNQEIAASHYRSLLANHLADVASSDHHTVKPWFTGKLDYAPEVHDFAAQGFPLLGGRLDYLNKHTVAALAYRHGNHLINVFMWPQTSGEAESLVAVQGYNLLQWNANGMHYSAISDMNAQELKSLRALLLQQMESGTQ